jgi:tetratricopeptide (TPR) repeat protein
MVDAWVRKGLTLFEDNKIPEALGCLNEAVKLSPRAFKPRYNRGKIHLQLNHIEEGIADLEKACSIKPEHDKSHELLGDAYSRVGDEEKAAIHWRIAEELRKEKDNSSNKDIDIMNQRTKERRKCQRKKPLKDMFYL